MDSRRNCLSIQSCADAGAGVQTEEPTHAAPSDSNIFAGYPAAPQASSALGLYRALMQLHHELAPVVANIDDGMTRSLLEALEAENMALRQRVQELESGGLSTVAEECLISELGRTTKEVRAPMTDEAGSADTHSWPELASLQEGTEQSETDPPKPPAEPAPGAKISQRPHFEIPSATERISTSSSGEMPSEISKVDFQLMAPTASMATSCSSRSSAVTYAEEAPERAFVINIRRLVEVQETFSLLHVLIESTAMAAITLCGVGSVEQFRCTFFFLVSVFVVFFMHGHMWDTLEVEDMNLLLNVINDDCDSQTPSNENRLLKAISFQKLKLSSRGRHLLELFFTFVCIWAWLLCGRVWDSNGKCRQVTPGDKDLLDTTCVWFVGEESETDAEVLGVQTAVGTLMFLLHLLFDGIHYNETCAVMPPAPGGGIWDPRHHGIPWRFWFFGGLPSMWFTSDEALDALKRWIRHANRTAQVVNISSQEIAIYALKGKDERQMCERTLKSAKLFDAETCHFIGAETLDIDLFFFDAVLHPKGSLYPGEFLSIKDNED